MDKGSVLLLLETMTPNSKDDMQPGTSTLEQLLLLDHIRLLRSVGASNTSSTMRGTIGRDG